MDVPVETAAAARFVRGPATWYAYLILAYFTFALNIQGNILPFLKQDLALDYRTVSLHSSAVAAGMILVGLVGNRIIHALGRRVSLLVGSGGVVLGGAILCVGTQAWQTIGGCAVIGAVGALIPATVFALIADMHRTNLTKAYSEANAICYAFAILAPLAMGICLAVGLGWRSALVFGVLLGTGISLWFLREPVVEPRGALAEMRGALPAAYWAYWLALAFAVAVEFCVLLWAPAFLEKVGGLSPAWAAGAAAAFSLAMIVGRTFGGLLIARVAAQTIVIGTVVVALAGFAIYWGLGATVLVVPGLFVVGLGVALLYPILLGLAVVAAGPLGDAASARAMLAVGIAVLTMPAVLGALADEIGLRAAHLVVPVLLMLALGASFFARSLGRRALQPA
ncbi:MAG TPA: MFS transporter [Bauldia sp.]|nr:MFS transporter [Bauldia sp.]